MHVVRRGAQLGPEAEAVLLGGPLRETVEGALQPASDEAAAPVDLHPVAAAWQDAIHEVRAACCLEYHYQRQSVHQYGSIVTLWLKGC